jgi:diaminopimelate decarboxylase/aspartate kinase
VLKFGGTSVSGRAQWETIASLAAARQQPGHRVLLVCSALAGVTDELEALTQAGADQAAGIRTLHEIHAGLATALDVDAGALLAEAGQRISSLLETLDHQPAPEHRADLLAVGEWLSSRMGQLYLAQSMDVDWVDARDALEVVPEGNPQAGRSWLSARCESGPDGALAERWSALAPVLITQGYVARTRDGRTALLGRGGSDTSAALLAGRLSANEVEIWTDVPGLFSADPAREPDALLIRELHYTEALEMAASGARVVHPRCIRAATDTGLSILIHDLARPMVQGTRISGASTALGGAAPVQGIKAVTFQDRMLVMLLENLDTRQQVGFLAWVFDVISRHDISIDLVATSETTTTVAINSVDNHLDPALIRDMTQELSARCRLRLYQDCCCVNLVGRGARTALSQMGPAAASFREWPLLMLSQSANDMCLSLLVYPEHANTLLHDLHECLITSAETNREDTVYGPAWRMLAGKG